jgi:hypothetical protein
MLKPKKPVRRERPAWEVYIIAGCVRRPRLCRGRGDRYRRGDRGAQGQAGRSEAALCSAAVTTQVKAYTMSNLLAEAINCDDPNRAAKIIREALGIESDDVVKSQSDPNSDGSRLAKDG